MTRIVLPNSFKDAASQSGSGLTIKQKSGGDHQTGRVWTVGHESLRVLPLDGQNNAYHGTEATYAACSGNKNLPHIVRIYDPNNFAFSSVRHHRTLSLKSRFGRSCRAFVNAWRGS